MLIAKENTQKKEKEKKKEMMKKKKKKTCGQIKRNLPLGTHNVGYGRLVMCLLDRLQL